MIRRFCPKSTFGQFGPITQWRSHFGRRLCSASSRSHGVDTAKERKRQGPFCDLPASDANASSGFPLVVTRSEETAAAVAAASTISFAGVEGFTGWLSQLRDAVYARPVSQERSTVRPRAPTNTCRQSPKADPLSEVPLLVRRVREY